MPFASCHFFSFFYSCSLSLGILFFLHKLWRLNEYFVIIYRYISICSKLYYVFIMTISMHRNDVGELVKSIVRIEEELNLIVALCRIQWYNNKTTISILFVVYLVFFFSCHFWHNKRYLYIYARNFFFVKVNKDSIYFWQKISLL